MRRDAWTWREGAGIVTVGILLALVMTYPVAFQMDESGPFDSQDGFWSVWNVGWVARALVTNPGGLYDTNIFYPHRNTLAYSVPNLGAGLLGAPVYWLTENAFITHSFVLLAAFVLSFLAAYALCRYLTGQPLAALAPAVAFAYCPYTFSRLAHIQLLLTAGIPLGLLALHCWVERRTIVRSCALGLALAAQGLACGYYGIFAGLAVGLGALYYAGTRRLWRDWRYWGTAALAVGIVAVIILPFLLPYFELQREAGYVGRTLATTRMYSADWRAYLASGAWTHRWMLPLLGHWKEVLFPGFLLLAVAGAGFLVGLVPPAKRSGQREIVGFYTVLAAAALWTSFGPQAGFFTLLYRAVPAVSLIRAPARIAILVVISLCVLGSIALARCFGDRPLRTRLVMAGGLTLLMTLELASMPIWWERVGPVPGAYQVLARLPRAPVVEFPFFSEPSDLYQHSTYMLNSTRHWFSLINGYSDHFPQDFAEGAQTLARFPTDEAFTLLRQRGARYAIFHLGASSASDRRLLVERLSEYDDYLDLRFQDDRTWLYEIVGWPNPGDG